MSLHSEIGKQITREIVQAKQVKVGTFKKPAGLTRGLVQIDGCDTDAVTTRPTDFAKGDSVLVVSAGGLTSLLPGPPAASGPAPSGGLRTGGSPYVAPPEVWPIRVYVGPSGKLYDGVLTIDQTEGASVLMDSSSDRAPAGGGLGSIQAILPDGGPGVGKNSLAGTGNSGGFRTLELYDGTAETRTSATSPVNAFLDHFIGFQPYPEDDEWLAVRRANSPGQPKVATLSVIAFDLSGGFSDVLDTSALPGFPVPNHPDNRFWAQFAFSGQTLILPRLEAGNNPPIEAYAFDRQGLVVTLSAWSGTWSFDYRDGSNISEPYGGDSWRIKSNLKPGDNVGGGSLISRAGLVETSLWSPTDVLDAKWSDFPDNSGRIIVGSGNNDGDIWIAKRDGSQQDRLTPVWTEFPPGFINLDAIWIVRE